MLVLDAYETRKALPFAALIDSLAAMFAGDCTMPVRHHHTVKVPGEADATLLLMPAWLSGHYMGVKMVSVFPGNSTRSLPSIYGTYLLSSGTTGELLAILDGGELTARRTAAASALAARHLARADSRSMLMVGTGRLSCNLIEAHLQVLPLKSVSVWGRNLAKAQEVADFARTLGLEAQVVADLESGCRSADLISCATLSEVPLVRGEWLRPGTHLDLIGAFRPAMRETDDAAVVRSELYVDTRDGVLAEGGDIVQPLQAGLISAADIRGDLAELVRGQVKGRTSDSAITLFKSVGAALEDLAAAILAFELQAERAAGEA